MRKYEYVIIRNDKEIGINEYGFDYLINLEKVLGEIREYINKNECNYIYLDCKLYETEIYKHLLKILDKVGKE